MNIQNVYTILRTYIVVQLAEMISLIRSGIHT